MLASTYVPRPSQPLQQQPWARAFTAAGGGGDAGGSVGGGGGGMNSGGSAAAGGVGEGSGFSQAGGMNSGGAFAGSVAPSGARGIASGGGGGGGGGSSIAAASSGMLMGSAAGAPAAAAGAGAQGHSVRGPCKPCPHAPAWASCQEEGAARLCHCSPPGVMLPLWRGWQDGLITLHFLHMW